MTRCSTHPNLPIVENPFGSSDHCHPTPGHEDREAFHCNGAILNRCPACGDPDPSFASVCPATNGRHRTPRRRTA